MLWNSHYLGVARRFLRGPRSRREQTRQLHAGLTWGVIMTINRTPRRWVLTLALCIGLAVLTAGPVQAAPARVRILDLGTLGGTFSDAIAINDRGQIAGTSTTASGQARSFI